MNGVLEYKRALGRVLTPENITYLRSLVDSLLQAQSAAALQQKQIDHAIETSEHPYVQANILRPALRSIEYAKSALYLFIDANEKVDADQVAETINMLRGNACVWEASYGEEGVDYDAPYRVAFSLCRTLKYLQNSDINHEEMQKFIYNNLQNDRADSVAVLKQKPWEFWKDPQQEPVATLSA